MKLLIWDAGFLAFDLAFMAWNITRNNMGLAMLFAGLAIVMLICTIVALRRISQ